MVTVIPASNWLIQASHWLIWTCPGFFAANISWTLLVITVVLLLIWGLPLLRDGRSLPPGPWGVPVLGYLPFIKDDVHLHFKDLMRQYGPMFSARLGNQLIVVLGDHNTIREAFKKEEFTGRPHTEFSNILGGYGVINSDGRLWKDQRKFLRDRLRHFGMTKYGAGKKQMEERIMSEVEAFINELLKSKDEPIDLNQPLAVSISNVICSIMMSVRFSHDDTRFKRFMALIDEGFKLFGTLASVNFVPIMRYLPGLQKTRLKLAENRREMAAFFQATVDTHRDSYNPDNIRDLIDTYLKEIQIAKEEGREKALFEGKEHDRQMQQIIGDLFSAGMETIKTTLQWAIVFMLHHPEVARAVQEELDQVVGRDRLPKLEDLHYLPYTESTILEVLRRSSIVPLGTTHATTKDVMLNGYKIPKDSQIVPLLHAVHMDPTLWEKPEDFQPNRFLNPEGKVTKPKFFLPFGDGRRMCLGDTLARMELFLFFSSIMHMFDLTMPEGEPLPSLKGNAGVTVTPDLFKVCLRRRPTTAKLDFLKEEDNIIPQTEQQQPEEIEIQQTEQQQPEEAEILQTESHQPEEAEILQTKLQRSEETEILRAKPQRPEEIDILLTRPLRPEENELIPQIKLLRPVTKTYIKTGNLSSIGA